MTWYADSLHVPQASPKAGSATEPLATPVLKVAKVIPVTDEILQLAHDEQACPYDHSRPFSDWPKRRP